MTVTVFLCEDSADGILTAVYDAWASRLGHGNVRLELTDRYTPTLFCEYRTVTADPDKASRVKDSICRKISARAWALVYRTALADAPGKADDIYRFLIGGFYYGAPVTRMLTEPAVQRIWDHNRTVGNEAHYYREFLRFDALTDGILLARIRPKADVLTLVTPHFADRIPDENFIILDVGRGIAAVHPAQRSDTPETADTDAWFLRECSEADLAGYLSYSGDDYRDLWCTFFRAITIEQRINPKLQRNRMPLRYREFAPEFQK